jgi:N-acetylneuraminic acid mutarotase
MSVHALCSTQTGGSIHSRTPSSENHFIRQWHIWLTRLAGLAVTVVVLLAFGAARASSSGPAAGGNTLTITGTGLGNGSDITNVTICGIVAVIQSQTANSVTVLVGAGGSGTGDIIVYSISRGATTFSNSYTYNPPGYIFGQFMGWRYEGMLGAPRAYLASASVNGRVYAIGGDDSSYTAQSTVYVYDIAQPANGWLSVSNLPASRAGLAAASVNGRIYAIGGGSSAFVYDPAQPTNGWLSVSNLPAARYGLAAASVNGKIYAIGGYDGSSYQWSSYQSTIYVYDPAQPTNGWLSVSNLPAARGGLAAASVNGKIYAIGGTDSGVTPQSTVYVYDPAQPTNGWLSVSNLLAPRADLAAASVNGNIYAIGGYNGSRSSASSYVSTVYIYDPQQPTNGWLSVSNLPAVGGGLAAASVNGNILAIGGQQSGYGVNALVFEGMFTGGIVPSSGSLAGGNTVTISGNYFGSGDVTNVTLCGIPANTFADQSPTQIVVIAGGALTPTNGDVAVYSSSCGVTVRSNAYTYVPRSPNPLAATNVTLNSFFANWTSISGATNYLLDVSMSSSFTSFVIGYSNLNVGNVTAYRINGLNAGATYYYRLRCQQNGFTSENSSTVSVQTLNGTVSASNGPAGGGNTITITGPGLGNGSDITSVTICGVAAVIQSQTANSVTVVIARAEDGGTGDIVVYSASQEAAIFTNRYTYTPPGSIFGQFTGWSNVSNLPAARRSLAAASVNGIIYAIGGNDSSGNRSTAYVYDPTQATQGWLSVSNLPAELPGLAAASVNGKLYAIGGWNSYSSQSTVYLYDPAQPTQGWLSVSNLPVAQYGLAAVTANGKIYAIGGDGGVQNSVCVYDPAQPKQGWLSVSNLPAADYNLAAASVNGKIFAIGGNNYGSSQSTVYVYDPARPTLGWLSVSNLPAARERLAAVSVSGKIYAIGGFDGSSSQATVYVYDPAQPTQGWLSVNNLPAACQYLAAASVSGIIYAIGGYGNGYQSTVYEGSFGSGVVPSSGPLAGGNTVTISGNYLGNGDVTNVTLCGIPATILSDNSPTQIVVRAGSAAFGTNGDVVVYSQSFGMTVKSNAYTYPPPPPNALLATNATLSSFFAKWTSVSGVTNYLLDVSTVSNFTSFVSGYGNLSVGNVMTYWVSGLNAGTTYFYRLRCEQNGFPSENSSTVSVQISGAISVTNGPVGGGNTLTISGIGLGNGSDITNVTICGVTAMIQSQTANSVTVVVAAGEVGTTGDIKIYSASSGVTTFANGYTYNPGYICGSFMGWSSVSNLPAARASLAATSVNGKIYAIGGKSDGFSSQYTVYVYDPAQPTKGWLSVRNLPEWREGLAAASVNGKIYAIGGKYNATVYMYDPAQPTQGWVSVSNLPAARAWLAAASVNGKIYAIGGNDGFDQSSVYVYDPAQPTKGWLSVSDLPVGLSQLAAASVNGKIYAIGGYNSTYPYYQSKVYVYDPAQPGQGWLSVSNLPVVSTYLAAASVNGKIYAIGGYNGISYQNTVYVYDPAQPTQGWLGVSYLPAAREALAAASVNGKIYAIGGLDGSGYKSTVYEGSFATGVAPSTGLLAGGNTVTISGNYLGNGDVTNVTLCGISATVLSDNSPTQIVVIAGMALVPTNGGVVVNSPSYGFTVKSNAYTYLPNPTPTIQTSNGGLGFSSGKFGFNLSGPAGLVVIIEASANLVNWLPIQTNVLINGQVRFTDSQAALFPKRFYRARFAFASSSQLVLQSSPAFGGVTSNQFGFNLAGRPGQTIVIEASTNLLSWTPLVTNSLLTGYYYFNDFGSTNFPQRFYRVRTQ